MHSVASDMHTEERPSPLPDDILIAIATQLKRTSHENADLYSLLLVSKQFYQVTIPILYGNIALSKNTIGNFGKCFNAALRGFYIRSLTIHIEPEDEIDEDEVEYVMVPEPNFQPGPTIQDNIARIAKLLPEMPRLSCFSLNLERRKYFNIHRSCIIDLIENLPETVTSLEIDTRFQDYREPHQEVHVCESLRKVFPRMQHIRLRLLSMCYTMFGPPPEPLQITKIPYAALPEDWIPTALPNLKSLLVSCGLPNGQQAQGCNKYSWNNNRWQFVDNTYLANCIAWRTITTALEKLVSIQRGISCGCSVHLTRTNNEGITSKMPTIFQIDMNMKENLAVPFISMGYGAPSERSYLVRLGNDDFIAGTLNDVEALIEPPDTWNDVVGGARLPAPILETERLGSPSWATGCTEKLIDVENSNTWRARNPTKLSTLWRDEEKFNVKLAIAKKRVGDKYLDCRPIRRHSGRTSTH